MNKKSIIILVVIILLIVIIYKIYKKLNPGKSLLLNKVDKNSAKILFIGDSLTLGYGLNNYSFVDMLQEDYPDITTKKIASTGKQTSWMLPQLQNELQNNNYDVVVIWGGINDIYATNKIDSAKNNLQQMYDLSKNSGAKVVAINIIPSNQYSKSNSNTNKLTDELNTFIQSNYTIDGLVDAYSLVGDNKGNVKQDLIQSDNLHLNEQGQSIIEKDLAKKILK